MSVEHGRTDAPTTPTGRLHPQSRRGHRTRAALLRAAREVFERDGFLEARISDITAAAGVATGSFYTYFEDKDEIFAALMQETREEMLHPGVHDTDGHDDAVAMIEQANRAYLDAYRRKAKLMKLLEQVATIDDRFFVERNARSIPRLQLEGKADQSLDPLLASLALSSMVSRTPTRRFAMPFPRPSTSRCW